MKGRIAALIVAGIIFAGCHEAEVSNSGDAYVFRRPENFPLPAYTFENNPGTRQGFELGRALFYDPILSADSSISCANCHQQVRSFSDPVHRFSKGVNDASGFRNAPALQNLAFQTNFFWDGGVTHLDFVPINAITDENEMSESLTHVMTKLNRNSLYPEMFLAAFGSSEVNSQKMLYALSQFMNLLISSDSRYDRYVRSQGERLSDNELRGLKLFQVKCSDCHPMDLFTDNSFRNNGLEGSTLADIGRERITEFPGDRKKFKVPSLRNAELTAPYMHDGRFNTLAEVLNHYAQSVTDSETLDPSLKQGDVLGIPMTDAEKSDIIAFIKTLTDKSYLTDERFSNPFQN